MSGKGKTRLLAALRMERLVAEERQRHGENTPCMFDGITCRVDGKGVVIFTIPTGAPCAIQVRRCCFPQGTRRRGKRQNATLKANGGYALSWRKTVFLSEKKERGNVADGKKTSAEFPHRKVSQTMNGETAKYRPMPITSSPASFLPH